MCIEAMYEPASIDFGVNTASRHRDPTPAVLQIKIHIDFIWTVNTSRRERSLKVFPFWVSWWWPLVSLVIDILIILHMLPQQISEDKHCKSINTGTDDETTKDLQGESRLTRFFAVLK